MMSSEESDDISYPLQCSYTIPPGCGNLSDSGERSSKPPDIPPLLQVGNYNDEEDYDDDGDGRNHHHHHRHCHLNEEGSEP